MSRLYCFPHKKISHKNRGYIDPKKVLIPLQCRVFSKHHIIQNNAAKKELLPGLYIPIVRATYRKVQLTSTNQYQNQGYMQQGRLQLTSTNQSRQPIKESNTAHSSQTIHNYRYKRESIDLCTTRAKRKPQLIIHTDTSIRVQLIGLRVVEPN